MNQNLKQFTNQLSETELIGSRLLAKIVLPFNLEAGLVERTRKFKLILDSLKINYFLIYIIFKNNSGHIDSILAH